MREEDKLKTFEQQILPHLPSAYNLARWLTRSEADAEDLVQEACLRAFRFFGGFRGENGRVWLLTIVRNTCYSWRQRVHGNTTAFEDEKHYEGSDDFQSEKLLFHKIDSEAVRGALEALPDEFREVVVLCELEGLSYREISTVTGLPIGTVMSRLSRARSRLRKSLASLHAQRTD